MPPKGRPSKKKRPGRSVAEMGGVREARARRSDVSRSDASAGAKGESGVSEDANSLAGINKLLIRGPDECLDECSGGGAGSSAAIVEVVEIAECAEISGKVQVRPRMFGCDELSEEVFDDLAGGSSVAPSAQARAGLSGSDHVSEEFFGGRQVG